MKLTINGTCNSTLDDMRIGASEVNMVGSLTFHQLAIIISAACTLIAILCSFFLIWMHALHYTKPYEQRHIIRILFMVPVYAVASFLSLWFYWHAVYFEIISSCYEAFAIASFFSLLCHYLAPDLHEQKAYFRGITPKPWVLPINWFKKCCGGERGPWRTPRSGLTWFNINWTGIYQYCFLRVTLTIVAVITQYFSKYCESSNSPVFAHIWVLVLEGAAVTIAMYCLIQFYFQLRFDLAPHSPFLKVLAIKLVIFLSFWQSFAISILTSSTLKIVEPSAHMAYPDLKIGIPSLLLCIEMAIFSILHLFAFPYKPYSKGVGADLGKYPLSPTSGFNEVGPKQGGFLGIKAIADAMNPWDMVKGFARGMRWLVVGRKHREEDSSYKSSAFNIDNQGNENDMTLGPAGGDSQYKRTQNLPIAEEFRRSKFGLPGLTSKDEERADLLTNAQPNPVSPTSSGYVPARQRYDSNGQEISIEGRPYDPAYDSNPDRLVGVNPTPGTVRRAEEQGVGIAISEPSPYQNQVPQPQQYLEQKRQERRQKPSEQWANSNRPFDPAEPPPQALHNQLWGAGSTRNQNQF